MERQPFLNDDNFFKSHKIGDDGLSLLKAKKVPVGTTKDWRGGKYKKVAQDKWVKVGSSKKFKEGFAGMKKKQVEKLRKEDKGINPGDTVKVPSDLTTDPSNKQGESGKVVIVKDRVVSVKFSDGKVGQYDSGVLEKGEKKEGTELTSKVIKDIVKKEKPEAVNAEVGKVIDGYKKEITTKAKILQDSITIAVQKLSSGKLDWGNAGSLGHLNQSLRDLNRELKRMI